MIYLFKRPRTARELGEVCRTPARLDRWMNFLSPIRGIRYVTDREQYGVKEVFQPPRVTLRILSGDCEDYAWLASAALRCMGVSHPQVITVKDARPREHAVCAFYYRGAWYHISNWGLKLCRGASCLADVPFFVYHDWVRWTEWMESGDTLKPLKAHYTSKVDGVEDKGQDARDDRGRAHEREGAYSGVPEI